MHGGNGVKAGQTSVSITFRLLSTAGAAVTGKAAADLTAYYWRQGGSPTSISLSDLAAINSAYSSGGVKQADATNMPGLYRIDVPDAAFATGADWVALAIKCTGSMDYEVFIPLESVGNSETYARVGAPVGASISADIAGVQSDTDNLQTRVPAALVSGRIDASVGAMAADVVTASAIAADAIGSSELAATAVTEIQSGLSTLTSANVASAVLDAVASSYNTAGTIGAKITTAAGAAGGGSSTYTATIKDANGATLDGVQVWATTDAAGSNTVASGVTNSHGQVTFALDPGSYYLWRQRAGQNFTNPAGFTVT